VYELKPTEGVGFSKNITPKRLTQVVQLWGGEEGDAYNGTGEKNKRGGEKVLESGTLLGRSRLREGRAQER